MKMTKKKKDQVRWRTISRIVTQILGRKANIHLSTALTNLIAFCDVEETGETNILVSAFQCKTEIQVIAAVAHELAHIKMSMKDGLNYRLHEKEFYLQLVEILKIFEKEMKLKNLSDTAQEMENMVKKFT